ncbi:MAG: hypothetical protein ACRCZI_07320 [Cetobacterium sp.]
MNSEISPYINSSETINYETKRNSTLSNVIANDLSEEMHNQILANNSTLYNKFSWAMPSIGVMIFIVIILIALWMYYNPKIVEKFLSTGKRDDLGGDSDYDSDDSDDSDDSGESLEDDVKKLYKMQKKNIK